MKKKNYEEDSDNEFDVDEPEELQENSEEDWAPAKKGTKRPSTGKRGAPKKKSKGSSDDDDEDEETPKRKKGAKGKPPAKNKSPKAKVKKEEEEHDDDEDLIEEEIEEEELEDEEIEDEEEDDEDEEETPVSGNQKAVKEFTSGSFVVLKTDFHNSEDPPLWKIDGKALLQKYSPFEHDGKTLYKNTCVYSGWTINNKDQYYPATVVFKQQTRKEHVVEFQRDLIQKEETVAAE